MWAVSGLVEMGPLEQGWEKLLQVNTISTEILPATPQPWLLVLFIPVELVAFSLAKISAVLTAPGLFLHFSLLSPASSLAVGTPVLHPKTQPGMCCKPTE